VQATHRGRAQLGLGGGGVWVVDDAGVGMTCGSRLSTSAGEGGCCVGWRRLAGLAGPADGLRARLSGLRPAAAGLPRGWVAGLARGCACWAAAACWARLGRLGRWLMN
jgi:hypothetical protein